MELNDYNAILQQLASTPGLQARLRNQFGLGRALSVIHENAYEPGSVESQYALGPNNTAFLASQLDREIQALPYQTGVMPGQAWPGDPNWKGVLPANPEREANILRYMKEQLGFQVPPFTLPSAPPLQ